jgi:hypothetical protein
MKVKTGSSVSRIEGNGKSLLRRSKLPAIKGSSAPVEEEEEEEKKKKKKKKTSQKKKKNYDKHI